MQSPVGFENPARLSIDEINNGPVRSGRCQVFQDAVRKIGGRVRRIKQGIDGLNLNRCRQR